MKSLPARLVGGMRTSGQKRISKQTLTTGRWFLSGYYPKAYPASCSRLS